MAQEFHDKFSAIETGVCAQFRPGLPLSVRAHCTNELISAPTQRARACTQVDKHAGRLPGLTQKSPGQLVALGSVINRWLQLTWRAAPHDSEGSLSAARSERASFL